jgi:hypothetical protein
LPDKLIDKWKGTGCFNGLSYFEKNQLAQLLDNQEKYLAKPGTMLGMNVSTIRSVERMNLPVAVRAFHGLAVRFLVSTQVPSNLTTRLIINEDNVKKEEVISTFTYKTKARWQGYPSGFVDSEVEAKLVTAMGDNVADEVSGMVLNDIYSLAHLEMISNGSPIDLIEAFNRASDCIQRKCGVEPNWIAGNSELMGGVEKISHGGLLFNKTESDEPQPPLSAGHIKITGKYGRYTFCEVPDASGFIVGYKKEPVESGYFLMPYLLSIPLFDPLEALTDNPIGTIACRVGKKVVKGGGDFYVRILIKK